MGGICQIEDLSAAWWADVNCTTIHFDLYGGSDPQIDETMGNEVTLSYTFARADVGERVPLLIHMRSNGEFHRQPGSQGTDASAMFHYTVNPSREGE